ncbi:MAG: Uma2 family endonuclease [Armatimonadetes bacterium]|nr:Uma2 family endonuclease [Armatimonadota bacterium]
MAIATDRMSEQEFLHLPDDGRKWELVDGEAKEVPAGFEHDVIGANVIALLAPHARGKGFVAGSQAGFRMVTGNIRSPDVSFTRKERLPDGRPTKGFAPFAPDLAVEVLSPGEDFLDLPRKVAEYFASGAQAVWLLEPQAQRVTVYHSPTETSDYGPEDEIDGGDLLPGFRCRVGELFAVE